MLLEVTKISWGWSVSPEKHARIQTSSANFAAIRPTKKEAVDLAVEVANERGLGPVTGTILVNE